MGDFSDFVTWFAKEFNIRQQMTADEMAEIETKLDLAKLELPSDEQLREYLAEKGVELIETEIQLLNVSTNIILHFELMIEAIKLMSKVGMQGRSLGKTAMDVDAFITWFLFEFSSSVVTNKGEDETFKGDGPDWKVAAHHAQLDTIQIESVHDGHRFDAVHMKSRSEKVAAEGELVAFAQVESICTENDGMITVPLVRRGLGETEVTVEWYTKNINIMEESYIDQSGTVVIPPGVMTADIEIEILDNDEWNVEARQILFLSNPQGAILGELKENTIVILNEDPFPHGEEDFCDDDGIIVPGAHVRVVKAFALHLYHDFAAETFKAMLLKFIPCLLWLTQQLIILFALTQALPQKDFTLLLILGGVYAAMMVIDYLADEMYATLRLGGKARMNLRLAIVSTVIQQTHDAAEKYPTGAALSITGDAVEQSVVTCWIGLLNIFEFILQIILMTAFTAYVVRHVIWLLAIPVVMLITDTIIMGCRMDTQSELHDKYMDTEHAWKTRLAEWVQNRLLITQYRWGDKLADDFKGIHKTCNGARFTSDYYKLTTANYVRLCHALVMLGAFVLGGRLTIDGQLNIGQFVALMGTTFKYDSVINALMGRLFAFINGSVNICQIARLLNSNTRRWGLYKARKRRMGLLAQLKERQAAESADTQDRSGVFDMEANPETIFISEVEYDHGTASESVLATAASSPKSGDAKSKKSGTSHLGPYSMIIDQGQIIAINGDGKGKKSFLMLLGRVYLPTAGLIYYPENLRVRYIPQEPMLFNSTIKDNLTFGMRKPHEIEDVFALCRAMGLSQAFLDSADQDCGVNGSRLSMSDRILICIVRAMVSSVDFLMLANTLDTLDFESGIHIMGLLRGWVDRRGCDVLPLDATDTMMHLKKKKTLLFVTKTKDLNANADATITMRAKH